MQAGLNREGVENYQQLELQNLSMGRAAENAARPEMLSFSYQVGFDETMWLFSYYRTRFIAMISVSSEIPFRFCFGSCQA
jgi:hypothetical protein